VRKGWQRFPKLYAWLIRAFVCLAAIVLRHPVDGMAITVWCLSLAAFALLAVSGVYAQEKAHDDDREQINFSQIPTPVTPTAITPQVGNHLFLAGHAFGSQGYVCLPKDGSVSWTVNGARPEATLFATFFGEPVQIITHFLSPNTNPNEFASKPLPFGSATWQSSLDSSKVWAQVLNGNIIPAGSDPSCPNSGASSICWSSSIAFACSARR
jgi:hypothetical protein